MRARRLAGFASLTLMIALVTTLALAQPRTGGRAHPQRRPPAKIDAALSAELDAESPALRSIEASAGTSRDAGAVEARTLDGGARVFRFGEVEIEGRLRSPQLVYFLRRVRAEFAAGQLGHRTFMRELSETRSDPNF